MSALIFLDGYLQRRSMYPFTLTREMVDLPVGLLTLREKWNVLLGQSKNRSRNTSFSISSDLFPSSELCSSIRSLTLGQSLFDADGKWMATADLIDMVPAKAASDDKRWTASVARIKYPWDLLEVLPSSIELDFSLLTNKKRSLKLPKQVQHTGKHPVFIEKGANIAACFLNTTSGPIYIGASAAIQEGAMIKGPFLLGQNSIVKMGAAIYGPTVVGANCLIGGEVKRSLMFPYSNKAHHGYLGDSVIGSWCNWGAGTSNSNLKNTAGIIRVEVDGKMIPVGQKAGVFMGDHSRTAINASLNSGTIIGVSAQVGVGGLTQKKISSFQWVGGKRYRLKEAIAHIRQWKALKGEDLTEQEVQRLTLIYKNDK